MQRIMVDAKLGSELQVLDDSAELVDVEGETLGRFIPVRHGRAARVSPPSVAQFAARERILHRLVERMKATPLPPSSPRLTRDELHERG